ncbi:beta-eliminating lyase-related protein [Spongiactinospora sp. TRM90649]|uniref:threonine aldolase family protein n=1 Tax=Spongiactinospora sp. TRM90649 TaxID=3031114 RepID=UPI0023F84124|nr:beta-eliminating lyase-related protein [Spongiactinospora sp. TRM90649]MDF5755702.1 beta-eliminating lyase-related protein [Spongiactinospora sp. TRM90649]
MTFARRHDPAARGFASDNHAGVHPEVLRAIALANEGHQPAYGDDVYTEAMGEAFRAHFGAGAQVWPVFNGTGANVVGLRAMCAPWEAVICAESAHVNTDEGGAPEVTGGLKLLTVPTPDGRLTPDLIDRRAIGFGDPHRAQPRVVSISNATELGTIYTPEETRAICEHAHGLGLAVHLDGARLANAAAALDVPLAALSTDAGVDVLSFGGTKSGLLYGEAVVVLDPGAARGVEYVRKTAMQLASKSRFVAAQFEALLGGDLWLRNARRANAMAARLGRAVADVPGVRVTRPVEANVVFAVLPPAASARLSKRFPFYVWDEPAGEVRWMCAFDTTEDDVDAFAAAVAEEMGGTG